MKINLSKFPQILFFLVVLSGLSVLVVLIQNFIFAPIASKWYFPFLESVGFVGAYTLLFGLFNKYLWKWPIFRLLRIVDYPDLNGRWQGFLISSFDNKKRKVFLEIRQTFLEINVDMYSSQSQSTSLIADFIQGKNDQIELHYEYQNEPHVRTSKTMNIHNGTVKLIFYSDTNTLKGSYYNANRYDRGHTGSIEVSFKDKKLLGRF